MDIVEVDRIRRAVARWGEPFLHRIFTPREIGPGTSHAGAEHFAGRFAAKEAVMKALGASNKTVNLLFAAEAALLALAGAAAGFILGSGIAFWIGRANFDAAILPQPGLVLPVLAGSMALALLASTTPLRILQRIQPAGILRGE